MRGDPDIIKGLNAVLTNELTSVNQYFLHARMFQNWGFERLGKKVYEESIGEMRHADQVIKRVLFLEGFPNLQDLHKLHIGETVPEALTADLAAEQRGREAMLALITLAEERKDYVTRDLISHVLEDTEEHIDFLETELAVIDQVGLQNYLQSQYTLDREGGAHG
jgi:bacterioferritin